MKTLEKLLDLIDEDEVLKLSTVIESFLDIVEEKMVALLATPGGVVRLEEHECKKLLSISSEIITHLGLDWQGVGSVNKLAELFGILPGSVYFCTEYGQDITLYHAHGREDDHWTPDASSVVGCIRCQEELLKGLLKIIDVRRDILRLRIKQAIERTRRIIPGYFENICSQRAEFSEKACGSVVLGAEDYELEGLLMAASWKKYSHKSIAEGCVAFLAPIPGRLGIIDIYDLLVDAGDRKIVSLEDPKGTGKLSAVVSRETAKKYRFQGAGQDEVVEYTIIILGPEKNSEGIEEEVVYTFHPGDPIRPSHVESEEDLLEKKVSVNEAIALGLVYAKIEG